VKDTGFGRPLTVGFHSYEILEKANYRDREHISACWLGVSSLTSNVGILGNEETVLHCGSYMIVKTFTSVQFIWVNFTVGKPLKNDILCKKS